MEAAHRWPGPGAYKRTVRGAAFDWRRHMLNFSSHRTEEKPPSEVMKVNMRNRDYTIVLISLCLLHLSSLCEGRPMRKRTVSEVQFMHNLGEHQQVQERRDWLQMRLRDIHTAAVARDGGREVSRTRRRLGAEKLPDLTPEEMQYALDFLEKLLKSKQS